VAFHRKIKFKFAPESANYFDASQPQCMLINKYLLIYYANHNLYMDTVS